MPVNSKYQPGAFDTLIQIKTIDGWSDDITPIPVYGACCTEWAKVEKASNEKADKSNEKADKSNEKADIKSSYKFTTRRFVKGVLPRTYVLIHEGMTYEITEVEQIGRRLHTVITAYKHHNG
jgi:hypothetical protein